MGNIPKPNRKLLIPDSRSLQLGTFPELVYDRGIRAQLDERPREIRRVVLQRIDKRGLIRFRVHVNVKSRPHNHFRRFKVNVAVRGKEENGIGNFAEQLVESPRLNRLLEKLNQKRAAFLKGKLCVFVFVFHGESIADCGENWSPDRRHFGELYPHFCE